MATVRRAVELAVVASILVGWLADILLARYASEKVALDFLLVCEFPEADTFQEQAEAASARGRAVPC